MSKETFDFSEALRRMKDGRKWEEKFGQKVYMFSLKTKPLCIKVI